jgi:hypothetical protein
MASAYGALLVRVGSNVGVRPQRHTVGPAGGPSGVEQGDTPCLRSRQPAPGCGMASAGPVALVRASTFHRRASSSPVRHAPAGCPSWKTAGRVAGAGVAAGYASEPALVSHRLGPLPGQHRYSGTSIATRAPALGRGSSGSRLISVFLGLSQYQQRQKTSPLIGEASGRRAPQARRLQAA